MVGLPALRARPRRRACTAPSPTGRTAASSASLEGPAERGRPARRAAPPGPGARPRGGRRDPPRAVPRRPAAVARCAHDLPLGRAHVAARHRERLRGARPRPPARGRGPRHHPPRDRRARFRHAAEHHRRRRCARSTTAPPTTPRPAASARCARRPPRYVTKRTGVPTGADNIVLTPGQQEHPRVPAAGASSSRATRSSSPTPATRSTARWSSFLGATPVSAPIRQENDFRLDVDELRSLVTPRTRLLIVNSPGQPHRRRAHARGLRGIAQPGHRARPGGAQRRDLRPAHLRRRRTSRCTAIAGHGGAHRAPRRRQQGVGDVRLAPRLRRHARRAGRDDGHADDQQLVVRGRVHPAGRRRGLRSPRSPTPPWTPWSPSSGAAATSSSTASTASPGSAAGARPGRSTCSPTSPATGCNDRELQNAAARRGGRRHARRQHVRPPRRRATSGSATRTPIEQHRAARSTASRCTSAPARSSPA